MGRDSEGTGQDRQDQNGETRSTLDAERRRREEAERLQAEHPERVAGHGRSTGRESPPEPAAAPDDGTDSLG